MASILSNERYALYYQKIGLLYKRPEIKASLEIILSIFAVTILTMAAIRPTLVNITSLQKKIEDQQAVDKKADNKIKQLVTAQKQLSTFAGSLNLYNEAVPDTFSYVSGAERIQYLAKQNSLTVESLTFSGYTLYGSGNVKADWINKVSKTSSDNILSESVAMTVSGKPQAVIKFLQDLENMDRLFTLSSVAVTKQIGLTREQDVLRAVVQGSFYFYSQSK